MRRTVIAGLLILTAGCGASHTTAAPAEPAHAAAVTAPVGAPGSTSPGLLAVTVRGVTPEQLARYRDGFTDPDRPQNGWFVVADVVEHNTGTEPAAPGGFYFQTGDGTHWDSVVEVAHDPELVQSGQGDLEAGDQQRGNVVFDTPTPHGQIVYEQDGQPVYRWQV